MKRIIVFAVSLGFTLLLTACSGGGASPVPGSPHSQTAATTAAAVSEYQKLSAAEAKVRMDAGGVIVVDVRTAAEYEEAHIPGARLLPVTEVEQRADEILPDKDAVLLIYCRTGVRSSRAAYALLELGYQTVYDFGGIVDWPYETVAGASGEKTTSS